MTVGIRYHGTNSFVDYLPIGSMGLVYLPTFGLNLW